MKITVPTSLNDITWEQYFNYQKVAAAPDFTENINRLALVSIFCRVAANELSKIPASDLKEIADQVESVLNFKPVFQDRFELNGIEYGFIPNLNNITAGEYIDLDTYHGDEDAFYKVLSILYRPVIKKRSMWTWFKKPEKVIGYQIEKYKGSEHYGEVMKQANLNAALGCMVFFYSLKNELLKATQDYLETLTKSKMVTEASEAIGSGNNTDGIKAFTP